MEKRIISFKGISNVPDDGLNEAGDMAVLMNMRHKGGELVPCRRPKADIVDSNIVQALFHSPSDCWIELDDKGNLKSKIPMSSYNLNLSGVKYFALMGNMVIISFEDKVEYAIWKKELRRYVYLGGIPEMPKLKASLKKETVKQVSSNWGDNPNEDNYNLKYQKGNIDAALATVYQEKGYIDRAWFRLGIRLFDGSYINIGEVYELSCFPNMRNKNTSDQVVQSIIGVQDLWRTDGSEYYTELNYFIPTFEVYGTGSLGEWADVITSIDLFSTGSIMSFVPGMATRDDDPNGPPAGIEIYKYRTPEQMKNALMSAEYYKVAEFDPKELTIPVESIENTSPSNIAVQDALNEVTTHSIIPLKSMSYNARLHTNEYKEKFFDGYSSPTSEYFQMSEKENRWTVYVHIKTDEKNVVVKRVDNPQTDSNETSYKHLYYFSYPDSRAYKMEVYDGDKKMTLKLSPNPYKNEAVYVDIKEVEVVINGGGVDEKTYYVPAISNLSWGTADSEPNINNGIEYKNTLKVSAVDNPFYFPTAQTYKFEGNIVGLASNAEAISTGQFGQYPLFVFTTEGIWAMAVDASGQGAYVSQSPFSREVCNGVICPVSGGVVFATDKGVMAISGGQVAELSKPLDGLEEMFFNGSGKLAKEIFARAGYDGYEKFEPVPIREYIQGESGAKLAYNYLHNEVILSNVDYGYSYVYNLDNQSWGMIDTTFDITTNSYPKLVVYNNGETKRYTLGDNSTESVPVVAITRPFTLGSFDFKRLRQAGLRTTFEGSLNFYLLGSNDGANFVCITGKEAAEVKDESGKVKTYRDLITAMSRSKQYKYFAIAIAGNMSGRVSMAELLVDAGFANNQIR